MTKGSVKRIAGAAAGAAIAVSTLGALAAVPAHAAVGPKVNLTPRVTVNPRYPYGNNKYEFLDVNLFGDVYSRGASVSVVQEAGGTLLTSSVWPISLQDPSDASLCSVFSGGGVNYARCIPTGLPNGDVIITGSALADDITINTPGHVNTINAGLANDVIHAFNSSKDHVNCQGGGADKAFVDGIDVVGSGCEIVKYSAK